MVAGATDAQTYYLLDTNILLAYIRKGKVGQYVEDTFHLMSSRYRPLVCVVSVGEIYSLAKKLQWVDEKLQVMHRLMKQTVPIDISDDKVLWAYAELYDFTRTHDTIPHNDLWIAATAKATGATLLTTDKHFDQLFEGDYIRRIWIDEEAVKSNRQ